VLKHGTTVRLNTTCLFILRYGIPSMASRFWIFAIVSLLSLLIGCSSSPGSCTPRQEEHEETSLIQMKKTLRAGDQRSGREDEEQQAAKLEMDIAEKKAAYAKALEKAEQAKAAADKMNSALANKAGDGNMADPSPEEKAANDKKAEADQLTEMKSSEEAKIKEWKSKQNAKAKELYDSEVALQEEYFKKVLAADDAGIDKAKARKASDVAAKAANKKELDAKMTEDRDKIEGLASQKAAKKSRTKLLAAGDDDKKQIEKWQAMKKAKRDEEEAQVKQWKKAKAEASAAKQAKQEAEKKAYEEAKNEAKAKEAAL